MKRAFEFEYIFGMDYDRAFEDYFQRLKRINRDDNYSSSLFSTTTLAQADKIFIHIVNIMTKIDLLEFLTTSVVVNEIESIKREVFDFNKAYKWLFVLSLMQIERSVEKNWFSFHFQEDFLFFSFQKKNRELLDLHEPVINDEVIENDQSRVDKIGRINAEIRLLRTYLKILSREVTVRGSSREFNAVLKRFKTVLSHSFYNYAVNRRGSRALECTLFILKYSNSFIIRLLETRSPSINLWNLDWSRELSLKRDRNQIIIDNDLIPFSSNYSTIKNSELMEAIVTFSTVFPIDDTSNFYSIPVTSEEQTQLSRFKEIFKIFSFLKLEDRDFAKLEEHYLIFPFARNPYHFIENEVIGGLEMIDELFKQGRLKNSDSSSILSLNKRLLEKFSTIRWHNIQKNSEVEYGTEIYNCVNVNYLVTEESLMSSTIQ